MALQRRAFVPVRRCAGVCFGTFAGCEDISQPHLCKGTAAASCTLEPLCGPLFIARHVPTFEQPQGKYRLRVGITLSGALLEQRNNLLG